jgi:hypothetical protein
MLVNRFIISALGKAGVKAFEAWLSSPGFRRVKASIGLLLFYHSVDGE